MYSIRQIPFNFLLENGEHLFAEHKQETESSISVAKPQLDENMYVAVEAMGGLLLLGAFDADDALIGYACMTVFNHPHYSIPCAFHDALFITTNHRKGLLGARLIKEVRSHARGRGVKMITWHAKIDSRFAALIQCMGAKPEETVFTEEI